MSDTLREVQLDGRQGQSKRKDDDTANEEVIEIQPAGSNAGSSPKLVRQQSWAEEVEREAERDNTEDAMRDKQRWGRESKIGSCWTEGLVATVRQDKSEKVKDNEEPVKTVKKSLKRTIKTLVRRREFIGRY